MRKDAELSGTDREFFRLVAKAAFSNPFTDTRTEIDLSIIGLPRDSVVHDHVDRVMAAVSERISRLESDGKGSLKFFTGEDRDLLRIAFLFDNFHQCIGDFDRLILEQVKAGNEPVSVPFAPQVFSLMTRRGLPVENIRHDFAVFYQLRRAFYFIDQGLIGRSPCMKELRRRLWNNVFTCDIRWYEQFLWNRMEDFSTLLLGETGTGKGAAAAAIGRSGYIPFDEKKGCFTESFTRNFIAINLSQYPASLIESELFGHRKGAFTGAMDHHEGVFSRCSPHGAIFLDEIGDVSVPTQVKLLQILQERSFSPVGSHDKQRFRGRVIAATNRPLAELRRSGEFRDDFFYRLCSDVICVPPLRQRLEEEPGELDELLGQVVERLTGKESRELAESIRQSLDTHPGCNYSWPGNVREVEQAARRIILSDRYDGDFPATAPDLRSRLIAGIDEGRLSADDLLAAYCLLLYRRYGSYEEVARRTQLDRRTAKKYINNPLS